MPSMPDQHRPGRSRLTDGGSSRGFTLMELLLVSAMGAVVLIGAITMLVSHIRSSNRMAGLLHLQDHCGWVQFMINREIEQAELASGGGNTLTLRVPGLTEPATITYRLNDRGELERTGPTIDAGGRLEVPGAGDRTDLVARGVTAFAVDVSNPRAPRYTITLQDANGVTTTIDQNREGAGGAFCRAREITRS